MSRQYKGLNIPNGLNKDSARVLSLPNVGCAAAGTLLGYDSAFCPSIYCVGCICSGEHRKELKELLKMWEDEDNPIKPGMVVKYEREKWCLVWSKDAEGVRGWSIGHAWGVNLHALIGKVVNVPYEAIDAGYRLKGAGEHAIFDGERITDLIAGNDSEWEEVYTPVLELTVEDKDIPCCVRTNSQEE